MCDQARLGGSCLRNLLLPSPYAEGPWRKRAPHCALVPGTGPLPVFDWASDVHFEKPVVDHWGVDRNSDAPLGLWDRRRDCLLTNRLGPLPEDFLESIYACRIHDFARRHFDFCLRHTTDRRTGWPWARLRRRQRRLVPEHDWLRFLHVRRHRVPPTRDARD